MPVRPILRLLLAGLLAGLWAGLIPPLVSVVGIVPDADGRVSARQSRVFDRRLAEARSGTTRPTNR